MISQELPDLRHKSATGKLNAEGEWECRFCHHTGGNIFGDLCRARVLEWGRELVAEEQAKTRALLEGLRDRIRADAAGLDRRSSSTTSANHHKAEQARKDARWLDAALTTLPGSGR